MKIIISENQLDKMMDKLRPLFDSNMEEYKRGNLVEVEREYEDWDSGDVYTAYVYYVDPEIDWEDDEFIFKLFPRDDSDLYNLEYSAWNLKNVSSLFNKNIFEGLLKDWFEHNYKWEIASVHPV